MCQNNSSSVVLTSLGFDQRVETEHEVPDSLDNGRSVNATVSVMQCHCFDNIKVNLTICSVKTHAYTI